MELITHEWVARYFDRRVEKMTNDELDKILQDKLAFAEASDTGNNDEDDTKFNDLFKMRNFQFRDAGIFMAVADLEMVPLYGSDAVLLVVPPNVKVTGDIGHSLMIRIEDIDKRGSLYRSLAEERDEKHNTTIGLLDLELSLAQHNDAKNER